MAKCLPGKSTLHGTGLFAIQTTILTGERILSEALMVESTLVEGDDAASTAFHKLFEDLSKLQKSDATTVHWLAEKNGYKSDKSIDQWTHELQHNSGDVLEGAVAGFLRGSINFSSLSKGKVRGLFKMLSLINHSCAPNAERYWNDDEQKMELRATIGIQRGQEILVSYIDQFNERSKRHSDLHFDCKCRVCSLEGPPLYDWENTLEMLRSSFQTLEEFQSQYLHGTDSEKASTGLISAIAQDPRMENALQAAQNVYTTINKKLRLISRRITQAARVAYVIIACRGIVDRGGDSYKIAYQWKLLELQVLANCRGIKHPKSRTVLRQLLNHAREREVSTGHKEATVQLRELLSRFNSSLTSSTSESSEERLMALVRDGVGDNADQVWSTL